MSNIGALHSVYVSVRETVLDKPVWDYYLDEEEIQSGLYELPMLSTGDYYMEHMQELDAVNGWPKYEMTVKAWYENEAGDGEDTLEMTVPAAARESGLTSLSSFCDRANPANAVKEPPTNTETISPAIAFFSS